MEYRRQSAHGLVHQGWKDTDTAIFHVDGSLARGPIALCEVQGYVYAAQRAGAALATALGRVDRAAELTHQAEALRERFEQAFWCEELSTYALALDGDKRPCRVQDSNAGQCPYRHREPRARPAGSQDAPGPCVISSAGVSARSPPLEGRYNPMGYHTGSVWPHDNALIAQGLARYGLGGAGPTNLDGAVRGRPVLRPPTVCRSCSCGFPKDPGEGPVLYPVACAPQAWAAGAVFPLFQACLGLEINAPEGQVYFTRPHLPASLGELWIHNLEVAGQPLICY